MTTQVSAETTMKLCKEYYENIYVELSPRALEGILSHDRNKYRSEIYWYEGGVEVQYDRTNTCYRRIRFLENYLGTNKKTDIRKVNFENDPENRSVAWFTFDSVQTIKQGQTAKVLNKTTVTVGLDENKNPKIEKTLAEVWSTIID